MGVYRKIHTLIPNLELRYLKTPKFTMSGIQLYVKPTNISECLRMSDTVYIRYNAISVYIK